MSWMMGVLVKRTVKNSQKPLEVVSGILFQNIVIDGTNCGNIASDRHYGDMHKLASLSSVLLGDV